MIDLGNYLNSITDAVDSVVDVIFYLHTLFRKAGFDLIFQKSFASFPNENNSKTDF